MLSFQHPLSTTAFSASSAGGQSSPASTTTALSTPGPPATMTRAPGSRYSQQDWERRHRGQPWYPWMVFLGRSYGIYLLLVASMELNCCTRGIL